MNPTLSKLTKKVAKYERALMRIIDSQPRSNRRGKYLVDIADLQALQRIARTALQDID